MSKQFTNKPHLTFKEACEYLGVSSSYLYKLTHKNQIPFYKPTGKLIFFLRHELDEWLCSNRSKTAAEIDQEATDYVAFHSSKNK